MGTADPAVEGLRARKRRQTRNAILLAARDLFLAQGVDKTSMESIAERADISTASLYNYFASKDLLLSVLIADGISESLVSIAPVFALSFDTALEGYMAVIERHLLWFDTVDRSWLRRFVAHAMSRVDLVESLYADVQRVLRGQIHLMTLSLARQGLVSGADADLQLLSKMVWSLSNSEFFAYLTSEKIDAKAYCAEVGRMVAIAIAGWPTRA